MIVTESALLKLTRQLRAETKQAFLAGHWVDLRLWQECRLNRYEALCEYGGQDGRNAVRLKPSFLERAFKAEMERVSGAQPGQWVYADNG